MRIIWFRWSWFRLFRLAWPVVVRYDFSKWCHNWFLSQGILIPLGIFHSFHWHWRFLQFSSWSWKCESFFLYQWLFLNFFLQKLLMYSLLAFQAFNKWLHLFGSIFLRLRRVDVFDAVVRLLFFMFHQLFVQLKYGIILMFVFLWHQSELAH